MPCDVSTSDRHIRDIEKALARAASRAEKLARDTGTPLVLWEDGRVVERLPGVIPTPATAPAQASK